METTRNPTDNRRPAWDEIAHQWIGVNDSEGWGFASRASIGIIAGVLCRAGFLDAERKEHAVVCSVYEKSEFPREVITPFKRTFLLNATCARCGNRQTEVKVRGLITPGLRTRRPFVVCDCGHPVWKITTTAFYEAGRAMVRPEYTRRRNERLAVGGAKHTRAQLQEILAMQDNRCIYCNVQFGVECSATIDHILPVSMGGTDWASNIVMACRRCNAKRNTLPFRTYCKTLSPTQNRRILKFLICRLMSFRVDSVSESEFTTFVVALRMHQPRNRYYLGILQNSSRYRTYASQNALLPTVTQLLKGLNSLLPKSRF